MIEFNLKSRAALECARRYITYLLPSVPWEKLHINVEIENVSIQFEADCGCPITAVPKKLIQEIFPQKKIEPVRVEFKQWLCDSVKYLGHEISPEGICPLSSKVEAIQETPTPQSFEEVQQLLGLINYYRRFIKDASSILYPLNSVLKQKTFSWTSSCDRPFQQVKKILASSEILVSYDPDLPLILATDASPHGLSGVLSHQMPDGAERPIMYLSRTLSKAEQNYSQLDKEATAVVWALKKVFQYCYGRQFTLVIDNRPLMSIFSPEKSMPPLVAARMLRYAQFLSGFSYNIVCKHSAENVNADYSSRNPTQREQVVEFDPDQELTTATIN